MYPFPVHSETPTCGLPDGVDVVGRAHPGAQQHVADDPAVELLQVRLRPGLHVHDVPGHRPQPCGQQALMLLDELTCRLERFGQLPVQQPRVSLLGQLSKDSTEENTIILCGG